jgi:hypothetical protein
MTRRWLTRTVCVLALLCLMAGCSDQGVVQPAKDSVFPTTFVDTTGPVDAAKPDASSLDAGTSDPQSGSNCEPGEGCFGEPCGSADDCLSGICTLHLGDKVCSKTCDEACPQGWNCTLVGSGGDGQYVCMSQFSHLCLPCEGSGGCTADTPNACVKYADGSSFCGGSCGPETPCPADYACQEVETINGTKSDQCVHTAGVCSCSSLAIDSALSTLCETTNEQGTCQGVRVCEALGLSDCSAQGATAETCNGLDDDCNGLTDEGTCDDANPCTVDTCAGEGGCQHAALVEGECLDGDACTIGDHCENGLCVGQGIDCDDDNPCTEDSCDGLGGCQHENFVGECDDGNPCTEDSCDENGCVFQANNAACDDSNSCTTDACDKDKGCLHTNNTEPCDDKNGCTTGDTCVEGTCLGLLACDDGNPCTDDVCEGDDCVFKPNASVCDDGNTCTENDTCVAGVCAGESSGPCCGNGVTEPGETCDGANCPTSCSNSNPCKSVALWGSADTCDAECAVFKTNQCWVGVNECVFDIQVECHAGPFPAASWRIQALDNGMLGTPAPPGYLFYALGGQDITYDDVLPNWCQSDTGVQQTDQKSGCIVATYELGSCVGPYFKTCQAKHCYSCP